MAHTKARMAPLFQVTGGAAEANHQKIAEALLGAREIPAGVHGREDLIMGDLFIECGDEALKAFLADHGI